eukprot:TRINITY_DN2454_c0_g6_i1.p1 TRINITY_DN2454_c0_g6~~TRINITY_DN2454_c0_g6_i1.p1  ORF type:complete len:516 (+),score=122.67 TRINITY_DN2454_c0_g6_i1:681-2228(+)
MIKAGLKTRVDINHFGTPSTIKRELLAGPQYAYQVVAQGQLYIVKGYQVSLEYLKYKEADSKARFISALRKIEDIYKEYFTSKIIPELNLHFARALDIDYAVDMPSDDSDLPYLYIEVLFECAGESLCDVGGLEIDLAYNLMRQSADALSFLQNMKVAHFEVNTKNLLYDKSADLLKIINLKGATHNLPKCKPIDHSMLSGVPELLPPEVFKIQPAINLESESVSIYCWAMTFYSVILNKNQAKLVNELERYKMGTELVYQDFVRCMKIAIENIKTARTKEKSFIAEQLAKTLSFRPEERPSINAILDRMKAFEENMPMPYLNAEKLFKLKLQKTLKFGDEEHRGNTDEMISNNEKVLERLINKINDKIIESARMERTIKRHKEKLMQLQRELNSNVEESVDVKREESFEVMYDSEPELLPEDRSARRETKKEVKESPSCFEEDKGNLQNKMEDCEEEEEIKGEFEREPQDKQQEISIKRIHDNANTNPKKQKTHFPDLNGPVFICKHVDSNTSP